MSDCVILYHYYYPDDVVSSRHFSDFAEGLASRGWNVSVLTSNRYCRKQGVITPLHETHNDVSIKRFRHPPFSQASNIGRLVNSFCLSFLWFFRLLWIKTDIIIFGTDPQFSYYIIPLLKFFRRDLYIAIWLFDLHPEMMFADGMKIPGLLKKLLLWWTKVSYQSCDLLIDIGHCMRNRLIVSYHPSAQFETIIPWALQEPSKLEEPDIAVRRQLFGEARLAILYSGTIAKAHRFEEFILLARELRKRKALISFCFSGSGNNYQKLKDMVTPEDTNITFAGFITEEFLSLRLASADIHMISLRPGWEGVAVPSKFFGSLASGRPLLYCGAPDSSVVTLIREANLGFIITMNNIKTIADSLETLSHDRKKLCTMQEQAFSFYNKYFTKELQCNKWDNILRDFIETGKMKTNEYYHNNPG